MAKRILTKYQEEQFNEWAEDGNVSKVDENKYLEHTTQWRKEFTLDELKAFFKREYLSETTYSGGGVVFKDKKYDITYKVQKSNERPDRWEVVESSPNWEQPNTLFFVTEQDATQYAKLQAGIITEQDPEEFFMNKTENFAGGGKITVSDITKGSKFKSKDGDVFIIDNVGEYDKQYKWTPVMTSWEGGSKGNYRDDIKEVVSFLNELKAQKIFIGGGVTTKVVTFPDYLDFKYYVLREDEQNYYVVNEEKIDHWKNANRIDKVYYYEEVLPKSEVIIFGFEKNIFADGGSIEQQNYAMIKSNNKQIMHHSKELSDVLKKNKTIPAWALALVNQSSQNLSNVTHYLEGAEKYATGGVSKKVFGDNVTFLDRVGNEQTGMVQDMDDKGAEIFYEERFIKVPTNRIVKFH